MAEVNVIIKNARDILVGKVPDPKAQIEQITIALMYKFMDAKDKESVDYGGQPSFFTEEYKDYAFNVIISTPNNGTKFELFRTGLEKMGENIELPAMFRSIFKNAFLPYNDPATLALFLKEIDKIPTDNSEILGTAFEDLLSIMGSQGDAGQFRTPRHIIDFIVEIVKPQKDERIQDPACGTAGFLVSAFNYINKQNATDGLTVEEKADIMQNIVGYDISPDMVRLAMVNMYLHGFKEPKIIEHDTLTDKTNWKEKYDVILANPPFMTPKGGIKPHELFLVKANRSEVLFVDYIMEHLTKNGRAGVIVPEGIVFQSQNAYKELRKNLVEQCLYAVVSLPSGVFNPYSGVKTSILLFDKKLSKATDNIMFIKIGSDGFDLGAQRRINSTSDLPKALELLEQYKDCIYNSLELPIDVTENEMVTVATKEKIAENGEYILVGDRHKTTVAHNNMYPMVALGEVCELLGGGTPSKEIEEYWKDGTIKWIASRHIGEGRITGYDKITPIAVEQSSTRIIPKDSLVLITRVSVGKYAYTDDEYAINQDLTGVVPKDKVLTKYLFAISPIITNWIKTNASGIGVKGITRQQLSSIEIPLPPLHIQEQIVAEIEGYQKIIDGAKQIVDNYKPTIKIDPNWEMVTLEKVCEKITDGTHQTPTYAETGVIFLSSKNVTSGKIDWENIKYIPNDLHEQLYKRLAPRVNDVLLAKNGTTGVAALVDKDCIFDIYVSLALLRPKDVVLPLYLLHVVNSDFVKKQFNSRLHGVGVPNLHLKEIKEVEIPLPPLETQQQIVAQIQKEQKAVESAKELIAIFEGKIKDKISEVWGD